MTAGQEISIAMPGGGRVACHLALPESGRGPGLLVLPEIYNRNQHICALADAYAEHRFVALTPDVYWRIEPGRYLPYTEDGRAIARALNARLDVDRLVEDLGVLVAALRARPECTGEVAVVGFCLGGKLAFLCAARAKVDAAVSYYGVRIEDYLDEVEAVACPLMLHFAGRDEHVPPEAVAAIEARLVGRAGVVIHHYPEAGHGFNRAGFPTYHAESARLAGARTRAFLAR